jgi:hypothetical protein
MPDFDALQQSLDALGAMTDASEAHGTLVGLMIGGQDLAQWISCTLDPLPDPADLAARDHLQQLSAVHDELRASLNSEDLDFELLLPDDDQEFALRLLGLAGWCRGFLYGLAMNGEKMLSTLSVGGRECMDDLLEISRLAHDEEQSEETETVYTELVEHVRLAAIYIHQEINPVLPPPTIQ